MTRSATALPALRFLLLRGLRNQFSGQVRRLRSPRYAIALLAGLAYLWAFLLRRGGSASSGIIAGDALALMLGIGIVLVVGWAWLSAGDRHVLAFTPAEVTFLFPAPLSRRALVHFKLARAQAVILLNTLLWALLLDSGRPGVPQWMRGVAIWCVFSTIHLHRLGAALTRLSIQRHGIHAARRRAITLVVFAATAIALIVSVVELFPMFAAAGDPRAWLEIARAGAERRPLSWVLAPFLAITGPLAAATGAEWVRALGPAAAVLLLHYFWVLRTDTAFEEAAAEASVARARALDARKTGAIVAPAAGISPPLVRLRAQGAPGLAIVWKNVTMLVRRRAAMRVSAATAVVALAAAVAAEAAPGFASALAGLTASWAGFLLALGPQWVRNDLRSDLVKLELLRSYPLSPATLVRAECAASTIVLTGMQLALCIVAGAATLGMRLELTLAERGWLFAALVLVLPALNFVGLAIHNGAALLFPAWVRVGRRGGGVEAIGQTMLTAFAYLILLGVALVPAAVAGGIVFALTRVIIGVAGAIPAAVTAGAVLAGEGWIFTAWLGGIFARTDPSAVTAGDA